MRQVYTQALTRSGGYDGVFEKSIAFNSHILLDSVVLGTAGGDSDIGQRGVSRLGRHALTCISNNQGTPIGDVCATLDFIAMGGEKLGHFPLRYL